MNIKLTHNYKKRVENFVINMLENPLAVIDYKGPCDNNTMRDDPTKNIVSDPQIYVKGFKHEKDRINVIDLF
jgi:hypothetical protein